MKGIFKGLNFMILIAKKFLNMWIDFCIRKKHFVYNPSKKKLSVFEYLSDPNLLAHKFYPNKYWFFFLRNWFDNLYYIS